MTGLHGAFNNAIAGVKTQSVKFGSIADNIANAATVGYKKSSVNFGDMVGTYLKPNFQVGGGVGLDVRQNITLAGSLQLSNNATSLGLDGKGMFAVTNLTTADGKTVSPLGSLAVTRKGDFAVDKKGNLVNSAGYALLGVAIPSPFAVGTAAKPPTGLISPADLLAAKNAKAQLPPNTELGAGKLVPVSIPTEAMIAASQTLNAYIGVNLPAETAPGSSTVYSDKFSIINSQGVSKLVDVSYRRVATATADGKGGTWEASLSGTGVTPATITLHFDSSGKITSPASGAVTVDGTAVTVHFDGYNAGNSSPPSTMFDGDYASLGAFTDGRAKGSSVGFEIDETGIVTQHFSNGISLPRFQIPVASSINIDGLEAVSGDAFVASNTSGAITLSLSTAGVAAGVATASGSDSTFAQGVLEASNVDIAEEFTNMIKTQNAYATNAKVLTTLNEMEGVASKLGQ
ncbi:MAG: flagellar hook-basal body complex protein [Alphaproteobacteria bacterium]|nr:flagellar hook-basal body complex protein [Alphaproteobacteria bacterium]